MLAEELKASGGVTFHFRKRCVGFTTREDLEADSVTIEFQDGTNATCDILVGCDGIKSAVRGQLLYRNNTADVKETLGDTGHKNHGLQDSMRFIGTSFCGTVAYRALLDPAKLHEVDPRHPLLLESGRKVVRCQATYSHPFHRPNSLRSSIWVIDVWVPSLFNVKKIERFNSTCSI